MTSTQPSDIAGSRIKEWRRRRNVTAEELATRCAELGAPEITAAVIANIETGRRDKATGKRRRNITLEELYVISEALGVAPLSLLVESDPVAEVAMYANRMLRGPFRLEINADADGVTDWTLTGKVPERAAISRDRVEAAAQAAAEDE